MTHENEDRDREAAHRLTHVLEQTTAKAAAEFGISTGAIATALISAGIRTARADMGPAATAAWLGDLAEEVARDPHPDCAGSA
jgi:hypothetical protein